MGMGEPLANYDETLRAIRLLMHPEGLRLGRAAHHAVDVGAGAADAAAGGRQACRSGWPSRCTRRTTSCGRALMPVNRRWPIAEVLDAAEYYVKRTGRRVSFEYTLMAGVNDSDALADDLAQPAARPPVPRQPDPAEPDRRSAACRRSSAAARPGVRVAPAPGGRRRDHSRQSRPRHPGRVRPAAPGRKEAPRASARTGSGVSADQDRAVDPRTPISGIWPRRSSAPRRAARTGSMSTSWTGCSCPT